MNETFAEKLARIKAQQLAAGKTKLIQPTPEPPPTFDPALIPDVDTDLGTGDKQMDFVLDRMKLLEAYDRYIGGKREEERGRTESIKVQCPNPAHGPDDNPSAWVNTQKNVIACRKCTGPKGDWGGDKYDLAAIKFGYDLLSYKRGSSFHDLKEQMMFDLGYSKGNSGGHSYWSPPGTAPRSESEPTETSEEQPENQAALTVLPTLEPEDPNVPSLFPPLDWRSFIPEGTFLWEWMQATSQDDVTEEYHFWNGMIALAFGLGRDCYAPDLMPVYPNLFVCTLGRTGDGKSRSRRYLTDTLEKIFPWTEGTTGTANQPGTRAVKIGTPGSGQMLVKHFMNSIQDPVTGFGRPEPVRGFVDFDEFATLAQSGSQQGSILKQMLQAIYDMASTIRAESLTSGKKEAFRPFGCVQSTTQPDDFKRLVEKSDVASGFMNRWLFVGGPRKPRAAWGGVTVDLTAAHDSLKQVSAWAAGGRVMTPDPSFLQAWEPFNDELDAVIEADETGLAARLVLTMKKLLVLLAGNMREAGLTAKHLEQLQPIYKYLLACYGIAGSAMIRTEDSDAQDALLYQIQRITKKTGVGPSASQLIRALKRRNWDLAFINKQLRVMNELGLIASDSVNDGKVGRPTIRYRAVGE